MDILHVLGFAGGVIVFVTLYYIGLNRWLVQEHAKIHSNLVLSKRNLLLLENND